MTCVISSLLKRTLSRAHVVVAPSKRRGKYARATGMGSVFASLAVIVHVGPCDMRRRVSNAARRAVFAGHTGVFPNCERGVAFRSMQIGTKSAPSGSSGVRDGTLESQFSDDPGADIPRVETSE